MFSTKALFAYAVVILIAVAWMTRYEVVISTYYLGVLDRWTGTTYACNPASQQCHPVN
jgi:hypothetical protein